MQKITIETVKKHCKGYTEAHGYYSCRKTDFDWLMNEAIESKQLRIAYKNTQQLRQKSAKMILAIVYLNERIDQLQVGKERMTLNLLQEKIKVADLLFACVFAKAQIKKNAHKKALPILRAAIAKAK